MSNTQENQTEVQKPQESKPNQEKVGIVGIVSLIVAFLFFSGILASKGKLAAFDFTTLTGSFGTISEGGNFVGTGGQGPKSAFALCLSLIPAMMLAMGMVNVFDKLGALRAAQRFLTPLMRPLLDVPGLGSFALITGLQSTDASSLIVKDGVEKGFLNQKERLLLVAWLFPAPGIIVNYFGSGPMVFDVLEISPLLPLGVVLVMKFVGSNIIRGILNIRYKGRDIDGES